MRSPLLPFVLLAATAEAGGDPAVLFNHFFVVTDAATYTAAQASDFLTREFAAFEKRTTVRNDQTYTGIYFYGRRTYFELFEPGPQGEPGMSGLAFGVEKAGESAAVKALWAKAAGGAEGGPVTRRTETDEVPWFEMTYAKGGRPAPTAGPGLRVWLMEYDRDFLARWYPNLTSARSITRADVLDRYVAKIGQAARRDVFLMKDVTSLTLALSVEDRGRLVDQLRPVGYDVREEKGVVVCMGPDVRLRLVTPTGAARGVLEVEFSLQSRAAPVQHRLGSAVLTIDRDQALLRFNSPERGK